MNKCAFGCVRRIDAGQAVLIGPSTAALIACRFAGPGAMANDVEQRRSAKLGITQRVKAAGSHEFKAGIDVENNLSDKARLYSGGAFLENLVEANQV
jgi:hypothetical protein